MSVPKRMRFEVFRRDGFRCRYCGATPDQSQLRPDHVVPEVLGGRTEPSNLVAACVDCNSGKGSIVLSGTVDDVDDHAGPLRVPQFAGELLNIVSDRLGDGYIFPTLGQVDSEGIPSLLQLEESARRVVADMAATLGSDLTDVVAGAIDRSGAPLDSWIVDDLVMCVVAAVRARLISAVAMA